MKKSLSLLLALLLTLSALPFTAAMASEASEPIELTFWHWNVDRVDPSCYVYQELEKKFNVKITLVPRTNETWTETIMLALSSGDIPDWFNDLSFSHYDKFVAQGVCAEVKPELIAEYAPRYTQWITKWLGDDPFTYYYRDGKNYSMPILWTLGANGMVACIRQDWLDRLGVERAPETLDELEAVFVKIRDDDSDGNGEKDTYGMTGTSYRSFSSIFGAFGVYPSILTEENGVIVAGEEQPGAKEALTLLNRWYNEGFIDPEFSINKDENIREKWLAEKYGYRESYWWEFLPQQAFFDGFYYEKLTEKNPEAALTIISPVMGPNGDRGMLMSNPIVSSGTLFGKHLEDQPEKLAKYIEVAEYTSFDVEVCDLLQYGVENVTYKNLSDEPGDIEWIPPYDVETERWKFGVGSVGGLPGSYNDYEFLARYMTRPQYRELRVATEAKGIGKYDVVSPLERPVYNEYADALTQLVDKNMIDFITGARSLDQFDQFVEEWKAAGGTAVLEEAQAAYDGM